VNRSTWNIAAAALLAVVLGVLGGTLPVPLVALGPGPTYNTLDTVDDVPVIRVDGLSTYPTSGHLNMTTIAVSDQLTMFGALGAWASGYRQVVPRSTIYPPEKSDAQVQEDNSAQFAASEANAEVAALAQLSVPTRVVVGELTENSPAGPSLQVGDELLSVAGKAVDSPVAVAEALLDTVPGQAIPVIYRRAGQEGSAEVVLGSSPDRPQGLLGVRPGIGGRRGLPGAGRQLRGGGLDRALRPAAGQGGHPGRRHRRPGRPARGPADRFLLRPPATRRGTATIRTFGAPTGTPQLIRRVGWAGRAVGPAARGDPEGSPRAGRRGRPAPETRIQERALWPCGPRWEPPR
jgi:hypothetical protein